jgi:sugar-specific transcriptional regulator TrmB
MEKILTQLGWSDYKKRTYIALLALRKATVGQIAKKSSIPSSKIYETLTWLHQNGYITLIAYSPLMYRANNPKMLLKSTIAEKIGSLQAIQTEVEKLNTDIETLERGVFNITTTKTAFMRKVKEACLATQKSVYGIFMHWKADAELLAIEQDMKNIDRKFLGPITSKNKENVKVRVERGANVKHYIPDTTRFTVWDERLVVISLREKEGEDYSAIWIENETLGKIMAGHFRQLWKNTNK